MVIFLTIMDIDFVRVGEAAADFLLDQARAF